MGDSLLSDSTRYEGSVKWLTWEVLPGVDDTVMFRFVPFDANRGVLSSVVFHLDNNEVPEPQLATPTSASTHTESNLYLYL